MYGLFQGTYNLQAYVTTSLESIVRLLKGHSDFTSYIVSSRSGNNNLTFDESQLRSKEQIKFAKTSKRSSPQNPESNGLIWMSLRNESLGANIIYMRKLNWPKNAKR